MKTRAQVAAQIAEREGWSCAKLRAFIESDPDSERENIVVGGSLVSAMWGFEVFIWNDREHASRRIGGHSDNAPPFASTATG